MNASARVSAVVIVSAALVALAVVLAVTLVRTARGAPDFSLVDQFGRPFSLSAQRGRAVVLFFGYTHCPDVCPTTLADEERAIRTLGPRGDRVEIAFVTVDPARDDAAALGRYAADFGPNVIALRGTRAELDRAYAEYHVYHQALPPRKGVPGYAVAHTSAVYYIARSGALAAYGDWSDARGAVTADLEKATA